MPEDLKDELEQSGGVDEPEVDPDTEDEYTTEPEEDEPQDIPQSPDEFVNQISNMIADHLDADVFLYNFPISRIFDNYVIDLCIKRKRRPNIFVMMVTSGGDADAAFRMARCFQELYEKIIFYVCGQCKSAGTLVAVGAHELIFSDFGELGPLDIQLEKKDEIVQMQSCWTAISALSVLKDKTFEAFENFFIEIQRRSDGTITVPTAAKIASDLTIGILSPISRQIDPMHLGDASRSMTIALHYGRLLDAKSKNLKDEALDDLISSYPSHGFVIDRCEAEKLFKNVRKRNQLEFILATVLGKSSMIPDGMNEDPTIQFLSDEIIDDEDESGDDQEEANNGSNQGGQGPEPFEAPEDQGGEQV